MKKSISVICRKNIPDLGKVGSIIKVRRGYAFNYLIPNKIVQIATKNSITHYEMLANSASRKIEAYQASAKELRKKIEQLHKVSIKKKVGKNQLIFGSISDKEIITIINNYLSINLEKQQIKIPIIKKLGVYLVEIQILDTIKADLRIQVLPKDI